MAEQHTVTIHNMEAERSQAVQQIKDQQQTLIHAALSEAQAELQSKSNQLEEHKATITRMKTEHDRAIQQIEDKQQHLINTATGEVRTELQGLINKLNYQVTAMTKEKRDLEITHNNTQNRLNRAEKWAEKREAAHLEQIAETRSKVWLQLHFDSKRGHRRTYYRHPHDTLQATYEDLRKSGIITPIAFRYANKRIRLDQFSMTWDQVSLFSHSEEHTSR